MDLQLQGKVIVVSGGALGIGEAVTLQLASEGAVPVVVGKDEADNLAVLEKIGQKGFHVVAELSDPRQCAKAISAIGKHFDRIDGLVNNAGINDGVNLEQGNYEAFIGSLHKNLVHYYLLAHHALPWLKKSRGPIVNISSKTAETGQGGTSAYAAANGGRNALTREWAVELLKYGIRVNAVIVAECFTPMYQRWIKTLPNPDDVLRKIHARIPFENRMTTPAEIANMVTFLLSPRSSHTTGQLVHVDGGYVHLDRALGQ